MVFKSIELKMHEDRIRAEIKNRAEKEILRLRIKRIVTMMMSVFIVLLSWCIIMVLSIYENDMQDYINDYNKFLGTWLPTVFITLVNMIMPKVLELITDYEEWEYTSTRMRHEVWRTYLSSILNNLIFAFIYTEVYIDKPLLRDTIINDMIQANR